MSVSPSDVRVSVVVPVYNEVECVEPLCRALHDAVSPLDLNYELLLIDDGSDDGSWERLVELQATTPKLRLLRFRRNFGHPPTEVHGLDIFDSRHPGW